MSITLHWNHTAAGQWRLVDEDEATWALIDRLIDERTGKPAEGGGRGIFAKPRFKAICPQLEYPQSTDEPRYWCLASTVIQAKHRAEAWLRRQWDEFVIVDQIPEPAFIPTLAGLRAIGVV